MMIFDCPLIYRDCVKAGSLTNKESRKIMGESFRSPGHVPVCIAASKGLSERQGHTELVTELFKN